MPEQSTCRLLFSGGFCTGKTTIITRLMEEFPIEKLPDYTTRAMRPGERQGFPYTFLTPEQFEEYDSKDLFFEQITFNGKRYGIMKSDLHRMPHWMLDVLWSSYPAYKKEVPDAIGIYLEPPSREELIRRARERGDSEEQIAKRLECLKEERPEGFDYTLPGDMPLEEKYNFIRTLIINRGCFR